MFRHFTKLCELPNKTMMMFVWSVLWHFCVISNRRVETWRRLCVCWTTVCPNRQGRYQPESVLLNLVPRIGWTRLNVYFKEQIGRFVRVYATIIATAAVTPAFAEPAEVFRRLDNAFSCSLRSETYEGRGESTSNELLLRGSAWSMFGNRELAECQFKSHIKFHGDSNEALLAIANFAYMVMNW